MENSKAGMAKKTKQIIVWLDNELEGNAVSVCTTTDKASRKHVRVYEIDTTYTSPAKIAALKNMNISLVLKEVTKPTIQEES